MTKPTAIVPCGTCSLCCRGEAIILHPEDGDRPEDYQTMKIWHPLYDKEVHALARKPDGDTCIYLGPLGGCTIHARRPAICRTFDCRKFAQRFTRSEVKKLGQDMAVWERGRSLRSTLGDDQ